MTLVIGSNGSETLTGSPAADTIFGFDGPDSIAAFAGDDEAYGGSGNDTIDGGDGADIIDGGAGADRMIGGKGDDIYVSDNASDVLVESADEGFDTVYASHSVTALGENIEQLIVDGTATVGNGNSIDNTIIGMFSTNQLTLDGGAGNDVILGSGQNDTLIGGAGNDLLQGAGGVNRLVGGSGDDTYYTDNAADVFIEDANEGFDTVYANYSIAALGDNIEQLIVYGAATTGSGNAGDNVIIGAYSANQLTLDGGQGNDVITGSSQNDTLIGGEGDDVLEGAGGVNRLVGGSGDDFYYVDNASDVLVENADEGFDTVYASQSVAALGENIEQLIVYGAATVGTGNAGDNFIIGAYSANQLTLDGGQGNDVIIGSGQNDTLIGGAGDDFLQAAGGVNRLVGGSGDDIYYTDNAADTLVEGANEGFDTVYTSQSVVALGENIEQLIVYGAATIGTGNAGNNSIIGAFSTNQLTLDGGEGNDVILGSGQNDTLIGGAGDDVLQGGAGINRLVGGSGDDFYYADNASDVLVESAEEGFDTVYANHSVTALGENIEQLIVYGTATVGNGNSIDNYIYGSVASNSLSLDGGAGDDVIFGSIYADTVIGGEGDDTLVGGAGADKLDGGAGANRASYFSSAAGVDVSLATGAGSGGEAEGDTLVNIKDLVGSDFGDTLVGDNSDNTFFGLGGSDDLSGGAGADSLLGGDGDDALNGGTGSDALFGEAGDDSLITALSAGDTDFLFGGEGSETSGDVAIVEGNVGINTYLIGGNGLGFVYVGSGAEAGENAANTFITDAETIELVTSSTSDDVEIAEGIAAAGTDTLAIDVVEGDDTVTVTANANTGLTLLQVSLGDGDDSFDFSALDAATAVSADGGAGDDSFQLHAGISDVIFDFLASGGSFGNDAVNGIGANDQLVFNKGSANVFTVLESLNEDGSHLLTVEADGTTVGTVNVSGEFSYAANVVIA